MPRAQSDSLERSRTRREWSACREAARRALSTARHWTAGSDRRRLRSIAGSRWFCWPGLVMVPWLVRALAARTFESFYNVEVFCLGGGRRKYGESIRCCSGWNETSWERSSGEDWTTADACRATEYRPIMSTRTMRVLRRATRRTFGWGRRKSTAGCDEKREAYEANGGVRRHNLSFAESCWP